MSAFVDKIDLTYERLTVIEHIGPSKNGSVRWLCQCECGNTKIVRGDSLANGNTKSCGCLQKDIARETHTTHGHIRTDKRSREYLTWSGMKARCTNPKASNYKHYGERGITICETWLNSFKQFLEDMGERPENTSIDRIDNDGNYEPDNCRWATAAEQRSNQRRNKE